MKRILQKLHILKNYSREIAEAESLLYQAKNNCLPSYINGWISTAIDHPIWHIRNIAVKMAGILKISDLIPKLVESVRDTHEIGFVRRNALTSLGSINILNETIHSVLLEMLNDGYWEVRSEAALTISRLCVSDQTVEIAVIQRLFKKIPDDATALPLVLPNRIYKEKNYEVRANLAVALGSVFTSKTGLAAIRLLLQDENCIIREATLRAAVNAINRECPFIAELKSLLSGIDLTSQDFKPRFPIRETYNEVVKSLNLSILPKDKSL